MTEVGMRVAVGQFNELTDEKLRFALQIGVSGIQLNNPKLPGEAFWEEKDIRALVERTRAAGLSRVFLEARRIWVARSASAPNWP